MNVKEFATLENAKKWNNEQDQFVFCVDLMCISAWDHNCYDLVDALEDEFETLLSAEGIVCLNS